MLLLPCLRPHARSRLSSGHAATPRRAAPRCAAQQGCAAASSATSHATRALRRAGRRLRATADSSDGFAALEAQLAREMQRRRGLVLFETELAKADEEVSVCRGALYIAMHHYREAVIDADAYVARLEDWGRELQQHLPPPDQRYTRRLILAINAFMFGTLGFRGAPNSEWSAVENSCLNHVMDARTGIPLTLSMVYLELARSAGLPMVAANLPGHLMIRPAVEDIDVLVDVFNSGAIITVEDAETQLGPLFGPGASIKIDRAFLEDNTPKPRTMLTRMLTNLKQSYFNAKQYDNALLMIEYQAACAPDASIAAMNQRDRGICLYLMGRHLDAIAELKGYLEAFAEAVDRKAIETAIEFCRAALADARNKPPGDDEA